MEFIENLINSSIFYYVLVLVTYILVIIFVIMLILRRKKKKRVSTAVKGKQKDIDSIDLESVLDKMQESVLEKPELPKTFEEEQEEKAIISYQELLHAVKKDVDEVTKVNVDELEVYIDPLEDIELPTLSSVTNNEVNTLEPIVLADELDTVVSNKTADDKVSKSNSKFQNSEFISPIYGRVDNEIEYPKIPSIKSENHKEKINTVELVEKEDNDAFLNALKKFRNNLE